MVELKYFITQPEIANVIGVKNQSIAQQASTIGLTGFPISNRTAYSPKSVRKLFEHRGYKYPQAVMSFQMLKGGSTKTSSAFNLAVRLNQYGARVLVIDADAQGNITDAFGYTLSENDGVLYHAVNGELELEDLIVPINEGLDLVPSNFDNSGIDITIQRTNRNIQYLISNMLEKVKTNYDFIIFDCNPALSALNISIALASDQVVIPINPDPFSRAGLEKTLEELERIGKENKRHINYKLLYTLHTGNEGVSRKYLIEYMNKYNEHMFLTSIRKNVDVRTALDSKRPIFDYRNASARLDFDSFAREVLCLNFGGVKAGHV